MIYYIGEKFLFGFLVGLFVLDFRKIVKFFPNFCRNEKSGLRMILIFYQKAGKTLRFYNSVVIPVIPVIPCYTWCYTSYTCYVIS